VAAFSYTTPQLPPHIRLSYLRGFQDHEVSLIEFLVHPEQIASFVYGQSFQESIRLTMLGRLVISTNQVKDAFLAFAKALSDNKHITLGEILSPSHAENGSKALQNLRSLAPACLEDIRTVISLALILVTYNDLSVGAPTLPISQSALLQALPWREQLICKTTEETDPYIICLLYVELAECIVLGELPIFRYEPPAGNTIVDTYYGISHELLPHLYDVCCLYRGIKDGTILEAQLIPRTEAIANSVAEWMPDTALDQRASIVADQVERNHLLLQARAFKYDTQLLVLQTRRSPLADMLARSKAIQLEAQVEKAIKQSAGRPKYLLFPYFVACLELDEVNTDNENKILRTMHAISNGMAPSSCQSMLACLKHVWRKRAERPELTWFECIGTGASIAMGP